MSKINTFIYSGVFILCFFSCSIEKKDVVGIYISRNNVNTIDTVIIKDDFRYINLMYRKIDNSLIYRNEGKWQIANNYIIFENFFFDEDDIHNKTVTEYDKVLITTRLPLEKEKGEIIIRHMPMHNDIYLKKIR